MKLNEGYNNGLEYGAETRWVYNTLIDNASEYEINGDFDCLKDISYANELEELCHKSIRKGIVDRLKELGINVDETDYKAIWKETAKLYKKCGIEPESVRKVINNWIKNGKVGDSREARVNMYNLCIALGFDIKQTSEFFFKRFLTLPFNYKDNIDAVYYYCIKNDKPYELIDELLSEIRENREISPENADTIYKKRQIDEIDNDEEFIDYLKSNCFSEEMQMQTARRIIHSIYEELGFKSISRFLAKLYGYNIQSTARKSKKKTGKSIGISKGSLPKSFTKSLPNDTQMAQILDNQKATYESLRKAIILLNFYNYYLPYDFEKDADELSSIDIEEEFRLEEDIAADLNDFYIETCKNLSDAGYIQLNIKYPFDWIILFCAHTSNPLATFRGFIQQGYTDYVEQ